MNKDQISKLQQALWKLRDAQRLILDSSQYIDPMAVEINNMANALEARLERGDNE